MYACVTMCVCVVGDYHASKVGPVYKTCVMCRQEHKKRILDAEKITKKANPSNDIVIVLWCRDARKEKQPFAEIFVA